MMEMLCTTQTLVHRHQKGGGICHLTGVALDSDRDDGRPQSASQSDRAQQGQQHDRFVLRRCYYKPALEIHQRSRGNDRSITLCPSQEQPEGATSFDTFHDAGAPRVTAGEQTG